MGGAFKFSVVTVRTEARTGSALGDEHFSLRTTLDFYKSASANQFPEHDEKEIKKYCYSRHFELQIAERNIERKRSSLNEAYDYVLRSYAEATKAEKKDMIEKLNEFQAQVDFRSLLQESDSEIMVTNAGLTELETQMAIPNLGKPKEMDKNVPHSSIKGQYNQHMDDETKGIIDPLLDAHNEQPDDQYSSQHSRKHPFSRRCSGSYSCSENQVSGNQAP
ncbi:hypothetical protein Aduo_001307 [Ancylostoma duodenale]